MFDLLSAVVLERSTYVIDHWASVGRDNLREYDITLVQSDCKYAVVTYDPIAAPDVVTFDVRDDAYQIFGEICLHLNG
jgi:hypothetical protein